MPARGPTSHTSCSAHHTVESTDDAPSLREASSVDRFSYTTWRDRPIEIAVVRAYAGSAIKRLTGVTLTEGLHFSCHLANLLAEMGIYGAKYNST